MAKFQNSFLVDNSDLQDQTDQDQFYGLQNLAEEEALKRHEEESEGK
tara:strand:+ start:1511 stop:1651 length:141 start_codon:yes stop_codon:yes gene_type:complete